MTPDPTSLDRLHDLVVPPPTPWWPLAPAWSWVLGVLALWGVLALAWAFRRWQHNAYRREALGEFHRQQAAFAGPERRAEAVAALGTLLKRTALSAWPREVVASLTGPAWLKFLDRTGATTFSTGPGVWIERVAYEPATAAELGEEQWRELLALARRWLAHHQVEAGGA